MRFSNRLLSLVQQLTPNLPAVARDALADAAKRVAGEAAAGSFRLPCLARPGSAPDLTGLRPRARDARRSGEKPAGGDVSRRTVRSSHGARDVLLFRPEGGAPDGLLVMLHGCTQTAEDFAAGTNMDALAGRHRLAVLYPEQSLSANPSRCWNWFLPDHQRRGSGEAAILAEAVQAVVAELGIPPGRVAVAGLSAGGAMAAILADAYPEMFAAVGIHSGLPAGAAHDLASALAAMRSGGAARAVEAKPLSRGVPTILFHGTADTTVHPRNATAIADRALARSAGLQTRTTQERSPGGRSYARTVGEDATGRPLFESWTIDGAGHAWAGGAAGASYTDPAGPDASGAFLRFALAQFGVAVA